jgi:hypothetical protein
MDQQEYDAIRAQIQERYERDLAALDRVWELAGNRAAPRDVQSSVTLQMMAPAAMSLAVQRLKHGFVDRHVKRAVYDLRDQPFTHRDVAEWIARHDPATAARIKRESIASVLARLAHLQQIEIVKPGVGTLPTIYQMAKNDVEDTPM